MRTTAKQHTSTGSVGGNEGAKRTVSESRRSSAAGPFVVLSWIAVLLATTAELARPGLSRELAGLPFLVSIALFGLSHGAVDLSIGLRLARRRGARVAGRAAVEYLLLLALSAAALLLVPAEALALFLALSAIHFGSSDRLDQLDAGAVFGPWTSRLWTAGRGFLIVGLPLAAHPGRTAELANALLALLGDDLRATAGLMSIAGRFASGLAAAGLLATVPSRLRSGRRSALAVDAFETSVLIAAMWVLDPLFALGTYFLGWHGPRQMPRVARSLGISTRMSPAALVFRIHRSSLVLLVPTLAVYLPVGLTLIGPRAPDLWALLLIAVFAIVTLPHEILQRRLRGDRGRASPGPGDVAGIRRLASGEPTRGSPPAGGADGRLLSGRSE